MRLTVTTTSQQLIANTGVLWRSYVVFSPISAGTVLVQPAAASADPTAVDMATAARWDFSKFAMSYTLAPGSALVAKVASGTVDLDILPGGEQ